MGYQRPCDAPVSSTWADHKNRNPPSSEPGTDYACAYGTPLLAADAGYISDGKSGNGSATGRYLTLSLNDGRTVRYLHLSSLLVGVGATVARGQVLAYSGASANGSDWGVGAHVHTTLWPGPIWAAPTIDFDAYTDEGNEDMTPEQAQQLASVFNAVFNGGPSMPDGSRSLGQSLADIAGGARPVVNRPDSAGVNQPVGWIQELADVRTAQINAAESSTGSGLVAPAWVVAGAVLLLVVLQVVATVIAGTG